MPRRRLSPVSPPCSSSDEHSDFFSDDGADAAAGLLRDWSIALTLESRWVFDSVEAWDYVSRGFHDDNQQRASEIIEMFIKIACRQMLDERLDLGWGPATPDAHRAVEADNAEAFRYTLHAYETVPWLFVIRAWEFVVKCSGRCTPVSPDPNPDLEVTVEGIVWDLVQTKKAQIRNSVYVPTDEPDWA